MVLLEAVLREQPAGGGDEQGLKEDNSADPHPVADVAEGRELQRKDDQADHPRIGDECVSWARYHAVLHSLWEALL